MVTSFFCPRYKSPRCKLFFLFLPSILSPLVSEILLRTVTSVVPRLATTFAMVEITTSTVRRRWLQMPPRYILASLLTAMGGFLLGYGCPRLFSAGGNSARFTRN